MEETKFQAPNRGRSTREEGMDKLCKATGITATDFAAMVEAILAQHGVLVQGRGQ